MGRSGLASSMFMFEIIVRKNRRRSYISLSVARPAAGAGRLYRFHATTSMCEKQKKASGSRPHARQAAAMLSRSERVAMQIGRAHV